MSDRQVFRGCLGFEQPEDVERVLGVLARDIDASVVGELSDARLGDRVLVIDVDAGRSAILWSDWQIALAALCEAADAGLVATLFAGGTGHEFVVFEAGRDVRRSLAPTSASPWLQLDDPSEFEFRTPDHPPQRDVLQVTTLDPGGAAIRALHVNDWFGPLACLVPDGDRILVVPELLHPARFDARTPSADVRVWLDASKPGSSQLVHWRGMSSMAVVRHAGFVPLARGEALLVEIDAHDVSTDAADYLERRSKRAPARSRAWFTRAEGLVQFESGSDVAHRLG